MAVVLSIVEIFILKPKFFENVSTSNLGSKKFSFTHKGNKNLQSCFIAITHDVLAIVLF